LFDTFAKEFFTKKQFMCTTASLQTLVNISKHETLKKFLKHCIVGLESYDATRHNPAANDVQRKAFRLGLADQFALMSSGRDRDLLATAFRQLPNLETVGIRDYEADGRERDGSCWRSYGVPTVFRETSCNLGSGSSQFASKIFLLLMQALADAERTIQVPCIEIILRKYGNGLNDLAFFLSKDPKMDKVLDGLQQLLLTINLDAEMTRTELPGPTMMGAFLHRANSLQHVRLNFADQRGDILKSSSFVLQNLCTQSNLLPNLRCLELGMLSVKPEILVQIISKFSATIRHVSFWKVVLAQDTADRWKDEASIHRYHPWPRVLRDLSMATQMTSMTVGCLSQWNTSKHGPLTKIHFSNNDVSRNYSGNMKEWLPKLLGELEVEWPSDDDEDSDQSETDYDGEDSDASVYENGSMGGE
jgi:hypothetical protein